MFDLFDRIGHMFAVAVGQHEDELVAREPADDVRRATVGVQALGNHLEQFIACRVAQRVVDLLETVEVDEQHRQSGLGPPRLDQRVVGLGVQQAAVGQLRQAVVERQLANAFTVDLALHGQRAQRRDDIDLLQVQGRRLTRVGVIERQDANRRVLGALDRDRPAALDPQVCELGVDQFPVRIAVAGTGKKRLAAAGGDTERTAAILDRHAFEQLRITLGEARRGERMHAAVFVDLDNRRLDLRRHPLDFLAHQLHHRFQWGFPRHGIEDAVLQDLVDLRGGDIGQDRHGMGQFAIGANHRVDRDVAPDPLAALDVQQFLDAKRAPAFQAAIQLRETRARDMRHQQLRRRAGIEFVERIAKQGFKPGIGVDHLATAVGDEDRVVGLVGDQRQQLDALALLALFGHILDERGEQDLPVGFDPRDRHRAPTLGAVLFMDRHFTGGADNLVDPGAPVRIDIAVMFAANGFWHQHIDVIPEHFLFRKAPEFFRRTIEQHHTIIGVNNHNTVDGLFQGLYKDVREVLGDGHQLNPKEHIDKCEGAKNRMHSCSLQGADSIWATQSP